MQDLREAHSYNTSPLNKWTERREVRIGGGQSYCTKHVGQVTGPKRHSKHEALFRTRDGSGERMFSLTVHVDEVIEVGGQSRDL